MMNLRKLTCLAIVVAGMCSLSTAALAASVQHKPQLPLQISIAPARPDVTPEAMRPGDVVEMAVTATAHTGIEEMRIEAKLQAGAKLVSGALGWSGPAAKGEPKQLLFFVRVPDQGTGRVKATVTFFRGGKQVMKRSAQYFLGADKDEKDREPAGKPMKDAKGRDIIEY